MFRDLLGRMGALEESCPHRGASLYFGRNEEGGLHCVTMFCGIPFVGNPRDRAMTELMTNAQGEAIYDRTSTQALRAVPGKPAAAEPGLIL